MESGNTPADGNEPQEIGTKKPCDYGMSCKFKDSTCRKEHLGGDGEPKK